MNNIWIATDWHLWNTEYDDGRHQFKSITRLGQLADEYTSVIGSNDLFIHLGDLCDPSNTRPENLKDIIQSIPGTKILCRGNHDTEPDSYYLDAGFNYVCDILKIHDIIFSHKPINITPDQINIHGHLHTRKLSTLDGRYINAYDINYSDKPALLEDLLQGAVYQKSSDYTGTEFKQDKIDKVFDSIEDDHYENILDLSSEFDLTEQFIQENETYRQMLRENSIPTGINVHDLMETTIAPVLHSLSATEIEKDEDPLDEIIFEEPEDTIKWEQGDDNPKLYKEKEPMAEAASNNVLYHGSKNDMNIITPKNLSQNEDNYVFATPDYSFALCFAANRWDDSIINQSKYNGQLYLTELKPGAMEETFDTDGYMYEVPANKFTKYHNKNSEFISTKSVKPLSKTYIPNILDELNKNGVTISYYPNKPHWWRKTFNEAAFTRYKDDYKPKNKKSINDLNCVKIDKAFTQKYKWVGESLKRNEIYLDRDVAYAWLTKNDKIVARLYITNEDYGDGYKWIALIEVENGYRGNGYGEQVLEFAINHEHGNALGVHKNNTVAINMYKKHGFKISPESQAKVDSGKSNYYQMYRGKGNKNINESVLKSEPDIYYNKDKFDSGEINLCFITGHSGSGKSTMAHGSESKTIEVYEIDDVNNVSAFSDDNLKEYGDLIYSYFKGPGKKYRVPYQGWTEEWYEENGFGKFSSTMKYYEENTQDFVHYAIKYAKSHTNKKFIIEGIQLFCYCNASEFKDYAVYIKGTSAARSFFRSLKRDVSYGEDVKAKTQAAFWKIVDAKNYAKHEKAIDAWRDYFSKQMESMNESVVKSNIDKDHQQKGRKSLSELKEVVMTADQIAKYKDDNKMLKHVLPDDGKDVNSDKKHFACVGWMDGINLAAIVSVRYPTSNSRDDYNWIQALEVTENYRGYGLSAQVLDYAVKKLHGNALAVHNDNEIAHKLYLKYGFKDGETNDINTKMYLGSINESILYTNDPVDIFDYKYEVIQEATRGDDTLYPVYVFLVNSGSLMAKMINAVTGDDYTHASIGFEPDLKTMYSFGGKQENGSGFGFSIESIDNEWYKGKDMAYAIYCVFVNKAQLKRMKDRVQYFVKHGTHFLFDFPGLVLNAMNVSANPQHRWFCSRFVADVLNAGSPTKKKQYIKDASYMRPNDFTQTNFAHYICGGIIKNFRASVVKAKTAKALEQEKTERMIRDKNWHYQVSRFQESVAELHSLDYDAMSKINTKYDIRPPGYNYERDREIAEYEKARAKKKAEKQKLKEKKIRDKNRQKLKAAKKAKTIKTIKNEEMEYNYLFGDQNRFFDWNDYHNTVLGESVFMVDSKYDFTWLKKNINKRIDEIESAPNIKYGDKLLKELYDTVEYYNRLGEILNEITSDPEYSKYEELPQKYTKNKYNYMLMKNVKALLDNNITGDQCIQFADWVNTYAIPEAKKRIENRKRMNENSTDEKFTLTLKDKSFRFINTITESTGYNGKLVPVYIILTYTGSFVSRTVKLFTGDEYTHASISFDSSLTTMYTFGRARDESITDGMFKIEDISSPYYQERKNPVPYGVFCVPVTPAEKKNMEKKIAYFAKNKSKFQFDFFGLILNGLGIPNNPKNRYFCSRFVAEILNAGDPNHPLVKEPSLQHPQTFAEDDYTYFVCSGPSIIEYDKVLCDRITKDILRTEQLARAKKNWVKNENFMNLNPYNPYQSNILHYKFAMLEDAEYADFMDYLSNFKIQYDSDDNIIVSRKEYDQLYRHYTYAKKNATIALEHGNLDGIKDELAKIHYIASMISKYYLSPSVMQNNRVKGDIKKDFAELRGLLLDTFNQFHSAIKAREPGFNFTPYYETSKYAKDNPVIEKIRTHLGETVVIKI